MFTQFYFNGILGESWETIANCPPQHFFFLNLKIPKLMVYKEMILSHTIGGGGESCMLLFREGELIVCLVFVFETGS